MRLLRFISSEELEVLLDDKVITPMYSWEGYNTTFANDEVVFFFDLYGKTSYYMKRAGYQPLAEGRITTQDKLTFYAGLACGIVSEEYAVIIKKDTSEVKTGLGTYADPKFLFSENPPRDDDAEVDIIELGVSQYSIEDVLEIWEEDWPTYKKIK